jgi:predicted DsbA family dithiol-disulfide isomerase
MTHTIDVICPWCYIGKRRLEKAIATQQHEVRVRWLPFQRISSFCSSGWAAKCSP